MRALAFRRVSLAIWQLKRKTYGTTAYKYDTEGILVSRGTTTFLNDKLNPTGYSQVFVETTGSTKKAFTCGHDLISQQSGSTLLTMLYDGLGSVRGVLNANGTIDGNVAFCYDAFGNTIGTAPSATDYRYAGERLDTATGWYYLRQRYYDPKTGRFNRLDPFWGNASDPQSLHKYTYCHGDPVNHIDPSGYFLAVGIGLLGGATYNMFMNSFKSSRDLAVGGLILRGLATAGVGLAGYFGTYSVYGLYGYSLGLNPLWATGEHPDKDTNLKKQQWIDNISNLLVAQLNESGFPKEYHMDAEIEAKIIAEKYVDLTWNKAKELGIVSDYDNVMYGTSSSGSLSAWIRNIGNKEAHCAKWAEEVKNALNRNASFPKYWSVTANFDYAPMCDDSIGFFWRHSFVSVSLKGEKNQFVFDPWRSGYPEIYASQAYFSYYGKGFIFGEDQ